MTTWQDVIEMEKQHEYMTGEIKAVKSILEYYIKLHNNDVPNKHCNCHTCQLAEAWLQRNRG